MAAPRRTAALLLSTVALAAAAGCGGSGDAATDDARGSNGDNELASSDVAEVLQAQRTIDAACGSDGTGVPGRSSAAIGDAVTTLAGLTEQYPDRVYETGNVDRARTMVTISGQVSEQLRRCGITAEAARLRGVADAA